MTVNEMDVQIGARGPLELRDEDETPEEEAGGRGSREWRVASGWPLICPSSRPLISCQANA